MDLAKAAELTLEQQANIAIFNQQADSLRQEHAIELCKSMFRILAIKDNMLKQMLMREIGAGFCE
jgi:hypothetical protein